ncbi:MAG: transcription antitermination factor NusB [Slackia sp.]|nr:transcription antitermination factor NusB [Slackia sp.]
MTDQHQGGYRGAAGRGGNGGGPRRGGAGRPAGGRGDGRSSGGYAKKGGYKKFDGGKPSGDSRGGYRDGKPAGGKSSYGKGKPSYDGHRDSRGGDFRGGAKPYKKFDGQKSDRQGSGYRGKSDGKSFGDKRQGFSRGPKDGARGGQRGPRRDFDARKKFDRRDDRRDNRRFDRDDERREQSVVERPAAITSPRASSRFGAPVVAVEKGDRPVRDDREQRQRRDDRRQDDTRRGSRDGGPRGGARGPRSFQPVRLSPGRAAACEIGRTVREREAFVSEVTPTVIAKYEGISPEDAAFATKIARGVTATLGTLDEFIDRNLHSPDDIKADVRDALRVSAYELLFLGKDAYAAVDQGVELVRSVQPKAAALANSVLRKMSTSAKKFPYGNPDLSLQVLARSQAFPLWLAKRLMNEMGLKQATDFMRACNADAPVFIAVNAIKADDAEVVEVFDQAGSLMEPSATVPGCYLVKDARVLRKPEVRALFENGSVCVSDESAQAIAALACPESDVEAFLEIGAGRGTKTILMQNHAVRRFGRSIPMVSVDDHAYKGKLLAKRVAAYGIQSVRPLTADARKLSEKLPEASFDAVLVDAPCSGVGTLRRHPEIRWRLNAAQIEEMASVEYEMLAEAAKMVKPGGFLTYATCTVFEEENARVVDRFLRTKFGESFERDKTIETTLSASGADAHYAVRMRRVF